MSNPNASPIFGVEIEVFCRVKSEHKAEILRYRANGGEELADYWMDWDFDLTNDEPEDSRFRQAQVRQRGCVKSLLSALIAEAVGEDAGWTVVGDASLREFQLTEPTDARHWWGVEIISPPMSIRKRWQSELRSIFHAICTVFHLWTHPLTSCHVHVSPGPRANTKYTPAQLTRIAKGAFYWEQALQELLPGDRRMNNYAKPNPVVFANAQYNRVGQDGWGPVFGAIDREMSRFRRNRRGQIFCFSVKIAGGKISDPNAKYRKERYLSTNFLPINRIGTVEFRRQGGVASAESAIHRVLLAVTLHVSALHFDFDAQTSRRTYPSVDELIAELQAVIGDFPGTCHGTRFVKYLRTCVRDYAPSHPMTEVEINARERRLQNSSRASISAAPAPAPAHGRSRTASMAQSRPPALAPAPVTVPRPRRQSTTAPPPLARPSTSAAVSRPVMMPAAHYPYYSYNTTSYAPASAMPVVTSRPAPSPYPQPSPYSSQYISTAPRPSAYPTPQPAVYYPSTTTTIQYGPDGRPYVVPSGY